MTQKNNMDPAAAEDAFSGCEDRTAASGSLAVNRRYKDSVFKMLFSNKKNLLELYNAINGTAYDDPGMLEVNTLENAVYMGIKNDISCVLDMRLNLYEHQSTWSVNLPYRFLEYIADLYSKMIRRRDVYKKTPVELPTPRFIIFYNGTEERPEREILKLSDLYSIKEEHPSLELEVVFININPGNNKELLAACKTLNDYAQFTGRIRKYKTNMSIEEAVRLTVEECIEEGILRDFLISQRAEVIKMSIYEYDFDEHMDVIREESYEYGFAEGEAIGEVKGESKIKAETSRRLARRGFKVPDIAEIVNTGADEVEQWLLEQDNLS